MTLTVYGYEIEFSEQESLKFQEHKLSLDGEYMELLLHWIDIDDFSFTFSDEERHNLCLQAIESYYKDVKETLSCAYREGLI